VLDVVDAEVSDLIPTTGRMPKLASGSAHAYIGSLPALTLDQSFVIDQRCPEDSVLFASPLDASPFFVGFPDVGNACGDGFYLWKAKLLLSCYRGFLSQFIV